MTASKQIKGLLASVATLALIGTAMAQGSPPNPAVKSAPVGAGQQSSQKTPMGETGTPAGGSTATGSTASGARTGSMPAASSSTTSSSTTMSGSGNTGNTSGSMGSTNASSDTKMASAGGTRSKRRARADRN